MTKGLMWVAVNGLPKSRAIAHLEDPLAGGPLMPLCDNRRWSCLVGELKNTTCPKCRRKAKRLKMK